MREWDWRTWKPTRVWPFVVVALAGIVFLLIWEVAS